MSRLDKFKFDRHFMRIALAVAVPLMLQQLITCSVNLVDNLMVGQLGDIAIGGVAAVNKFYVIATFGTNGVIAAASVFLAQFFGAKDEDKMKQSFRVMIISSYVIMISFFLLCALIPNVIVSFFTSDQAIIELGASYMKVAAFSYLPMALTLSIANAMRSIGETKIPLKVSALAVLTNTILNYCLIFGAFGFPKLGVIGAALATVIARVLEVTLMCIALYKGSYAFKTRINDLFKVSKVLFKKILIKAAPLAFNEVMWSFGMATLFKFYSTRGAIVMSGYSIGNTIADIFFTLFAGMATASTVLISQPLGANKLEEAKKHAYQLLGFSFILSIIFSILMFGSSFLVPYLYSAVSTEAKEVAQYVLRVQSCMYWIYMLTTQCYFILRAGGDMKHTLLMDSGFMWFLNVPVMGIFTYFTDIPYIQLYLIGAALDLVKLNVSYRLVRKERWVHNLTHIEEA